MEERENGLELEAVKAETDPLKRFQKLFDFLKSQIKNETLRVLDTTELTENEMDVWEKYIQFLKKMNGENYLSADMGTEFRSLQEQCEGSPASFKDWMNNRLLTLYAVYNDGSIETTEEDMPWDFVEETIQEELRQFNPGNIY